MTHGKGDDMCALLWETEWSEMLLQVCPMMGKSFQDPVVGEDSGEGDRGAGVSTCCLARLQLFSALPKTKAVLSAAASAHRLSGQLSHQLTSL